MNSVNDIFKKYNTPRATSGQPLTAAQMTYKATNPEVIEAQQRGEAQKNNGKRALETAGYFFNKLGLSFMRGIEGIADFTAGGIAELFGNDEYAERQMSTDWMNYNYADEWYKPRNGFEQFMGDLGGGIGSSLPALAAVAIAAGITYATAGAGATVAVPLVGSVATSTFATAVGSLAAGTTAFLSAGGTAASEAYKQTGNLGGEEWKYAAGSGAIEGGTEAIMNLAGLGVGSVGKKLLGKSAGKVVATGVGKTAWNATKNFVSEGVEEVISDAVDPYLRRATIDPNAKNATAQELLYTGIVGGFSSLLMGGGNAMVSKTVDFAKGEKIAANPDRAKSVMAAADEYSNMESKKATGSEVVEEIAKQNAKLKELMNKNTLSPFDKAKISELLGSLERLETIALFDKMAVGETMSILSNPDAFANSIPNGVYIDPEGNKHTVTKETLTKGIVYKDGKADGRSISKAIKTNGTLRAIVAARVAGTVLADAGAVYTSMLEGNKFFNSNDELNEFYENATPDTRERVKNEMGIDMEIDNIDTVNQKLALWKMSGAGEQYKANLGVVRKAKALEVTENELPMIPTKVKLAVGESRRYADGTYDIAITRDTDGTYTIVDINEGRSLSGLSRDKLNEAINAFRKASLEESTNASTNATNKADEATKADRKVSETDAKNEAMYERISNEVKGYDGLSAPNKRAVRSMVRKAIRLGVSDEYIVSSARYMTVTGINLQFVPDSAFTERGVNGMYRYSDGTVYLNAEINQKTFDELIVHETSHALYKSSPKLKKVIDKLAKDLTEEQRKEIRDTYQEVIKGKTATEKVDILNDEFGAHYLEYILGKDGMLSALLSEDGSISENLSKVIDKTSAAYKTDKNLYPATKRVFKAYKKALTQFSESNANMNAYADVVGTDGGVRYAIEKTKINNAVKTAITNKGKLDTEFNQVKISAFPTEISNMISLCSDNMINLERKNIAINGDDVWHEYKRHSNKDVEDGFNQIPLTPLRMSNAICSIYNPDIIECVFASSDNPKQRQSFAYAKKVSDGYYVVVEAVGGKRNPNVTPVMVLIFSKSKWTNMMSQGLTLGEILYSDNAEMKNALDVAFNKKNRVIAAQLDLNKPTATTPHSPRLDNIIPDSVKKINPSGEKSSKISVEEGRGAISAKDRYADFNKPITSEDIAVLRTIPRKSINEFTSAEIEKSQKWAYKFYKELGVKSPFFRAWFGDWRAYDKKTKIEFVPLNTGKISAQDVPRNGIINQDTKWKIEVSGKGIDKTSQDNGKWSVAFHSLKNINEMISNAILMDTTVISEPSKKIGGSAVLMHSLYCPVSIPGNKGVAKLYVIESYTDTKTFYLTKIEMVSTESGEATKNAPSLFSSVDTAISIAQMYEFVKVHDKNYEANSKNPVYFNPNPVNPLLLNADGTPKVFYHGTNKIFETFKPGQSGGIYLADNRRVSEAFTKTDNVMEVYPSLKNPLVVDALVTSEFFGITSYKQSFYYEIPTPDVMKQKGYTQATMATEEISEFAQKNGYDGVIITNVREIDGEATTDVIVFSSEQIKSAAPVGSEKANIGAFDSGMGNYRYSLSAPSASTPPKFVDPARRSAVLTSTTKQYKPTWGDLFGDQKVKSQMAFTNTQAGLERLMREVGYTREEAEAQVQFARLGYSQASSIIGGKFIDISQSGAKNLKVVGKGLSETLAPILPKKFTKNPEKEGYSPEEERYLDLQMLMLHKHNLDRMGLEAKAKKQYLPLEAIGDRLGKDSHKLGEAIKDIGKWQAQIEVYENDIKEAKDKANTDADFIEKLDLNSYIEERTTKINNLRKNIDRAVNTLVNANDATKFQDMLTMDEAMLNSLTDAKYTAEDIDALVGNQAAVLATDDINTLASLSTITDPIEKLRAIKKIVDRYAKMLDSSIQSLKAIKNKPLLGKTITVKKIDPNTGKEANVEEVVAMTADESRDIIKEYEKHYKDDKGFWEAETNIREYLDNLMQLRVNSGLVTAGLANDLSAMYPNYVPGYRIDASSGLMVVKGSSALELNKGVAKAKGSIKPIRPFHETLAEQTISAVRSARLNEIMVDIYERHKASNNPNKEKHFKIVETVPLTAKGENVTAEELYDINYADPAQKPKDNQITFYYKGEKITAEVSKDVFVGFEDLAGRRKMLWEGTFADNMLDFIMGGFRAVTINWNPAFIARNFFKDFGDALITSRVWSGKYATKYASTLKDIKNNSELWQLYVASGGLGNSFVDEKQKKPKDAGKRGFEKVSANANPASWLGALGQTVENANKFVEQLPRFAAFKIALESGASVAQAMNEAAEITTNFQRGGTITRFFNKIIPFLNASVQGFFKYPRRIIKAFGSGEWDKVMKQLALLLFNAVLIGIVPMVINELLCKDVEGYKELRNTDKENYYLIPMGDGQFVKIPRGRIQAAMSSVTNLAMGKSTASETRKNVSSQLSPWGTMTRTIFSPIKDVSTNTTWYGGEIEGMQFDNIRPSQRKDENTSSIAIWIADIASGAGVEWSPKKIDYLLGQYTGFFGDVVIDATKQKAMGNPIVSNFTVDSVTSNKLSTEFYKYYNEAQFAKNEGNETAIYQLKYLNKVKKQIRELYDQKSAIQSNSALSNKEKLEQTRILQSYINGLYAAAIDQFATVTDSTEATSGYGLEENDRFREVIRISFGAEAALESWNEDVYVGAKLIEKSGVDFEKYYDFYFSTSRIESDKDKNGNTVSGSKRAKVKKLVTEMDISTEQKVLLLASKGYSVKDGEFRGWTSKNYKSKLLRYIFSLSLTKEEKASLAQMCGFKVVNGRIIS